MEGDCPPIWGLDSSCKLVSSQNKNVKLTVNNVLKEIRIFNIFGVIKGFEEPGKDPWGVFVCFVFLTLKNVARGRECRKADLAWFPEMLNLICPKGTVQVSVLVGGNKALGN